MDKSKLALVFLLLLSLVALPIGALADEQESPPSLTSEPTLSAELGYSGTIAYLRTMPLTITVNGGSLDIEGTICVDVNRDREYFDRYEYPVTVAARSAQRITIPVKLSMRQPSFNVRLTSGDEVLVDSFFKPTRELGNNIVLVGTLSPDAPSLSYMNMSSKTDPSAMEELWTLVSLNEQNFPNNIDILNAFNLLMVDGFDVRTLSESQQATLKTWIEQGGILILGGGAQASTAYPFFERITTIKATGLTEATDIPSALLAAVTKATPSLEATAAAASATIPSPQLMLNTASAEISPFIAGTHPLIYQTPLDKGFILTSTFELGAKPLAQWSLMHSMWLSVIRSDNGLLQAYNDRISQVRNSGYGYDDYNSLSNLAVRQEIPIDRSAVPALVLLGAYLLLAGVISYLILKKMDKREWMWLTVPVLAIVFAFLVRALGAKLEFDRPLAVTVAQINYDQNGKSLTKMSSALSSSSMKPLSVSTDPGYTFEQTNTNGYYYDYYDSQQNQKQPTKLNYRYLLGDEPALVLPNVQSWTVYSFKFKQVPLEAGSITGRAWMEEDGLHAEIHNESGQKLTQGAVIGNIGFNRMKDISTGETGTAFLKQTEASKKGFLAVPSSTQNPRTRVIVSVSGSSSGSVTVSGSGTASVGIIGGTAGDTPEEEMSEEDWVTSDEPSEETESFDEEPSSEEGEEPDEESGEESLSDEEDSADQADDPFLSSYNNYGSNTTMTALPVDGEMRSVSGSNGYMDWDYLTAIANPDAVLDPLKGLVGKDGSYLSDNFLSSIYQEINNYRESNSYSTMPILNYVALADDMPAPSMYVDGQKIQQTVNRSFVNVALSYEPIGPTGIVCYLPDMVQPRKVKEGFKDDPTQTTEGDLDESSRSMYYELSKQLDFVFDLKLEHGIDIDLLEVSAFSNDVMPKMSLYNLQTKSWDECLTVLEQVKGDDADKYFADGKLYLRVTPDSETVTLREYMGSMPAPSLALKGRVK